MSLLDLYTTVAERAVKCSFAVSFWDRAHVIKNGGSIVGTPVVHNGIALDGINDNATFELAGNEFDSSQLAIMIRFNPSFAATDDKVCALFDASVSGADDYFVAKLNNASNNVLRIDLGNTLIAQIPEIDYASYWLPERENVLFISSASGSTYAWLNGFTILDNDSSSWNPTRPLKIWVGCMDNLTWRFEGTILEIKVFHQLFEQSVAADYSEIARNVPIVPEGYNKPSTMVIPDLEIQGDSVQLLANGAAYNRKTGKKYYVSTTGDDGNDGLTSGTALRSVYTASQKSDVDEIIVEAGVYTYFYTLRASPTRDLSIICESGTATFLGAEYLSWVTDPTYTNLEKATRAWVGQVYDSDVLNSDGLYTRYTEVGDLPTANSTPGSWYSDGVSVWVNALAGSSVGNNILAMLSVKICSIDNTSLYVEDINFFGGSDSGSILCDGSTRQRFGAKNCSFSYSLDNGLQIVGNIDCTVENCFALSNVSDGFNYHKISSYLPTAIEVNCQAYFNGDGGDNVDNGSTMHDAGHIARFGGSYYRNHGPNVVDVNISYSWNMLCAANNSRALVNNYDFYIGDGYMWLDRCSGSEFYVSTGAIYSSRPLSVAYTAYQQPFLGRQIYTYLDTVVLQLPCDAARHDPSHTTGVELLVDGDMEAVGTSAWTVGASAILTKEIGTPHGGTQCLRVAHNGVSFPYAYQTVLTVGRKYRVTGWARGDGTYLPYIYSGSTLWTGEASATWRYFDFYFTATATYLAYRSKATAAGYAEFDDLTLEQTEARTLDISSNNYHAIFGDGITESTFPVKLPSPEYVYDGNAYLLIEDTAKLRIGTHDFFVALKFNRSQTGTLNTLIAKGSTGAGEWQIYFSSTSTILRFYADAGNIDLSHTAPNDAFWNENMHTVIVTRIGEDVSLYIDGVVRSTVTGKASIDLNTAKEISIGAYDEATGQYFIGSIGELWFSATRGITELQARDIHLYLKEVSFV